MTNEKINALKPPQLRKALKDLGENPMSPKFGKGQPDRMRKFLLDKHAPKKAAAKKAPKVKEAPATKKATKKPKVKDDAPVVSLDQRVTELELRMATLEQGAGISAGTLQAQPTPNYVVLADFMEEDENGDEELVLDGAAIKAMTEDQCDALGTVAGIDFGDDATLRIKKLRLVQWWKQMQSGEIDEEVEDAPATPKKGRAKAKKAQGEKTVEDLVDEAGLSTEPLGAAKLWEWEGEPLMAKVVGVEDGKYVVQWVEDGSASFRTLDHYLGEPEEEVEEEDEEEEVEAAPATKRKGKKKAKDAGNDMHAKADAEGLPTEACDGPQRWKHEGEVYVGTVVDIEEECFHVQWDGTEEVDILTEEDWDGAADEDEE